MPEPDDRLEPHHLLALYDELLRARDRLDEMGTSLCRVLDTMIGAGAPRHVPRQTAAWLRPRISPVGGPPHSG